MRFALLPLLPLLGVAGCHDAPKPPEQVRGPIPAQICAEVKKALDTLASQSGTQPKMNAKDVIRIGRSRRCAASIAASRIVIPSARRSRAYSTIRIAFFAASPINVTMPICV